MDEKNKAMVVDRDKSESGKRQSADMHNNFVNKTLNEAREAKHPAGQF